jgi:hypothetical protein
MSDTIIFGKTVKGHAKSILIYVGISLTINVLLGVGAAFFDMEQEKWLAMWWMKKTGWWMMTAGGVLTNMLNTYKAATSNSTRPPVEPAK